MLRSSWFPWKFIVRRFAGAHGFIDPVALLARLHRFGQPSEVAEPIELLRAGAVFHARGLINSRVIQHNLDWVWPYWAERQFDPRDEAFVPRAFSITHINMTNRNWTAVGLPDVAELPIVDPRGLVTPFLDGWSLDGWVLSEAGEILLPSRTAQAEQALDLERGLAVVTEAAEGGLRLGQRAEVLPGPEGARCEIALEASAASDGWAVVSLRPYNPEGISFIHRVALSSDRRTWTVEDGKTVRFSDPADHHHVSDYASADVFIHLRDREDQAGGECDVGMVTAAALFRLRAGETRRLRVTVPLAEGAHDVPAGTSAAELWRECLDGHCALRGADARTRFLFEAAVRSLVLHSPEDVYPGPYTYKRFWFRDAAFLVQALLCLGLTGRAERALDRFPERQSATGYFHSQDGEWDSNGEALWILQQFCRLTGRPPKPEWRGAILRGASWIGRKRLTAEADALHAGLLPPGFSAEHLGPNDYYYWDDFWGIAGLRAAAELSRAWGDKAAGDGFEREALAFEAAVDLSLARVSQRLGEAAMPASPYRRLDAGAIGSLAAGYPLRLVPPDDPRLLGTAEFLLKRCFLDDGFMQDVVHSGVNPYLTLHVAQVLLRAGDPRCFDLMDRVAALASPTGQWPEAVHPRTGGGCMGDGQHIWAAAEWVLMVRNCFLREEGERLILASGVRPAWLEGGETLAFGPAPTPWGPVSLSLAARDGKVRVSWDGAWRDKPPEIEVRLPGRAAVAAKPGEESVEVA